MAGLHNGPAFDPAGEHPSHMAALPFTGDVTIAPVSVGTITPLGTAHGFDDGTVYNRTLVDVPGCASTIIEMRWYAHRTLRDLFVTEVEAWPADSSQPWAGCSLPVDWAFNVSQTAVDVALQPSAGASWAALNGSTLVPELPTSGTFDVAVVFDSWVRELMQTTAKGETGAIVLSQPHAPACAYTVLRSSLDTGNASSTLDAAVASFEAYRGMDPVALHAAHAAEMVRLWASGGIEVTGNATLAAIVNASLANIYASLRPDWPYSTAPGSIAGNAYGGHRFWDEETWNAPVVSLLQPRFAAESMAGYRAARIGAALDRAAARGYPGAMWPWQCAVTGEDTSRVLDDGDFEQHIGADILMAHRLLFHASGNASWLRDVAWPMALPTCEFIACRFTRTDSPVNATEPGTNCSVKTGSGNWTVRGVVPPDEAAGPVDDNAYTNAAFGQALLWCIEAASALGQAGNASLPLAQWVQMAVSPYMPLSDTLNPAGGPVHQEYTGYGPLPNGKLRVIQQSDVALLQFPLGLSFGPEQGRADLDFWLNVTDMAGMFTGDTCYTVGYLGLGLVPQAEATLAFSWAHIDPAYLVWRETGPGQRNPSPAPNAYGSHHFITGAASFLQVLLFGYPGLRVPGDRAGVLSFAQPQPTLPASLGVTGLKLRGLHLSGSGADTAFDFFYNATSICIQLNPASAGGATGDPLYLLTLGAATSGLPHDGASSGAPHVVAPSQQRITGAELCVPLQPVEVVTAGAATAARSLRR